MTNTSSTWSVDGSVYASISWENEIFTGEGYFGFEKNDGVIEIEDVKISWWAPEERNYDYEITTAEFELPEATSNLLDVEPYATSYNGTETPNIMVISQGEVIPAGYFIPRISTIREFQDDFVELVPSRGRVGFYGGYLSGSLFGGNINEADEWEPEKYIFNNW
jgi:hypothetical protein